MNKKVGGGKITNNIILSYDGNSSFLRKLAVEMDYPAASDLIIQSSADEGITWSDNVRILAGTSTLENTTYYTGNTFYRLKTTEDDTYVYTLTLEER